MATTFIYALCEPGTRTVRYIGKTRSLNSRFQEHGKPASTRLSTHLGCWLRSLKVRGERPDMIKLSEVPEAEGSAEEIRYIQAARAIGLSLVNSTDGGDGVTMTNEIREKISARMTGELHPNYGEAMPARTRQAIHDSLFQQKRKGASSGYLGVDWNRTHKRWRARILVSGKEHPLGKFTSEAKAARAYDAAALHFFGPTTRLNFMV